MDTIKERLQKLKSSAKERSKYLSQSSELDKASCSSTIQTSSDSDGAKENKMTVSSYEQSQSSKIESQHQQEKHLKSWKSESEINGVDKQQNLHSSQLQGNKPRERHKMMSPIPERAPSGQRASSAQPSTKEKQASRMFQINGRSYTLFNIIGRGGTSVVCFDLVL